MTIPDYAETLDKIEKLEKLKSKLYELRTDLPNVLQNIAQISDKDTASNVFSKTTDAIVKLQLDLNEFLTDYKDDYDLLALGKQPLEDYETATKFKTEPQPLPQPQPEIDTNEIDLTQLGDVPEEMQFQTDSFDDALNFVQF